MKHTLYVLTGFGCFLFFFTYSYVHGAAPSLTISIETSNLSVGAKIKALASSANIELESSTITWTHNGVKVLSGKGETSYTFNLGAGGKPDALQLSIRTNTGQIFSTSKTIYPGKVHFTWYSDTYTPPWYRGKNLISSGMPVTIVAIPEFIKGSPAPPKDSLIYTWSIDGRKVPIGAGSGRGKNSYTFMLSSIQDISYTTSVEIKNDAGTLLIKESVPINAYHPTILFYEKAPLDLIDHVALLEKSIFDGDSLTLEAEPFYTPRKALQNMNFSWRVNGRIISGGTPGDKIFHLTTQPGNIGKQNIAVVLQNPKNILQTGGAEIPVTILQR